MRLWGNVAAFVISAIGLVWTLQGANILGGSFMSGRSEWLYIGILLLIIGGVGFWWVNSRAGRRMPPVRRND